MSSREAMPVTLAPRARQDFIDILRYTGETWGHDQMLTYRDKINDALQALGANPRIGHPRDDLPSTHHAHLAGSHVIVYRARPHDVAVVRILHQRMSLGKHV